MLAAFWTVRATGRLNFGREALHLTITVIGGVLLLGVHSDGRYGPGPHWEISPPFGWALFGLSALGFAFCWYARIHLGRLWSASVARKADHHIVDSGPYGLVRHPIYTGLIVAGLATGVLRGTLIAVSGSALMALGWWMKARLEEQFLAGELGAEAYADYCRRVPMLVPFTLRRG
jgi:protein-S-isoprenylcysteine O-methyltransferase Ste14